MASQNETIHILRKVLYIIIFLFAIYGITSIGILVNQSRHKRPVSLSSALILLVILLAFLLIFGIIICLWRRALKKERDYEGRRNGRDEEDRWITMPDGSRYIMTNQALKELKRSERRERRLQDRNQSIWNAINPPNQRLAARDISSPKNPTNGYTGEPLERISVNVPPIAQAHHFTNNGIFGGRPAMGAGFNPNHGLSPPTSPKARGRSRVKESPKELRKKELKINGKVVGASTVWDPYRARYGASADVLAAEASQGQKNAEVAPLNISPHKIPRKEVDTPPTEKGRPGTVIGVNGEIFESMGSGAVVGVAGERVAGVGVGKLPFGIVGEGMIAIPTLAHPKLAHPKFAQRTEVGRRPSGRDSWRQKHGYYANRTDGELSMVSEEKSDGSKSSGRSRKSWDELTADEVERERKRLKKTERKSKTKKEKEGKEEKFGTNAASEQAQKGMTRVLPGRIQDENGAETNMSAGELEWAHKARAEQQKMRYRVNGGVTATALACAKREIESNRKQEMESKGEEQWLRDRAAAALPEQEGDRRKIPDAYPFHHLSAIPPSLRIQPPSQREKKRDKLANGSMVPMPSQDEYKFPSKDVRSQVEVSKLIAEPAVATSSYIPYVTEKPAATTENYHPPIAEEGQETDWQAQKRAEAWVRQNEEEEACRAILRALQPRDVQLAEEEPTFSSWHHLYTQDARDRGVSGFTDMSLTTTANSSANEKFSSFSDIERERKANAARTLGQMLSVAETQRSSEESRKLEEYLSHSPRELEEMHKLDESKYRQDKHASGLALAKMEEEVDEKPLSVLDVLPSQEKVAREKIAKEDDLRQIQEPAARLVVRSLKSTERGTTFSKFDSVQVQAQLSLPVAAAQPKSNIPRLAAATVKSATTPLPGMFGYQNVKKENADLAKKKAVKVNGGNGTAVGTGAPSTRPVVKPEISGPAWI